MRSEEKMRAVDLRKQGMTYSEILAKIPVAKSTLSNWLKDVGLAKKQQHRLTVRKQMAAQKGANAMKTLKEERKKAIMTAAHGEIGSLSKREAWLIGTALYWAEGSKEKEYRPGSGMVFNNSDPAMVKFYIKWLIRYCGIHSNDMQLTLYIHESAKLRLDYVIAFWLKYLGLKTGAIYDVYFKKSKPKTVRKNVDDLYYGTMRVKVSRSSSLNRKVSGWIQGIVSDEQT